MAAKPRYLCLLCDKPVPVTVADKYGKHQNRSKEHCDSSGTLVSATQLAKGPIQPDEDPGVPEEGRDFGVCAGCGRRVPLRPDGLLVSHDTMPGAMGSPCQSANAVAPAPSTGSPAVLPPAPRPSLADLVRPSSGGTDPSSASLSTQTLEGYRAVANAQRPVPAASAPTNPTRYSQPGTADATPSPAAPVAASRYAQPGVPPRTAAGIIPMSEFGQQLAASVKQLFYHYNQRKADDNRTAQTRLGPSEIGTPCDRRLVMSLLSLPAVNPGGDGWAAWVGTQGHAGLANMFVWADSGSGRYAVETSLDFPSELVPRGTGDLLDRTFAVFIDHKFMGRFSLDKLRTKGPTPTYRVQIHTYAYGARQRGEKVDRVAIIAWPREGASLDDLYVWDEPYDPTVAPAALARVADLNGWAQKMVLDGSTPVEVAKEAAVANDCRFCDYYAPGDKGGSIGCNGKK